MCVLRFTFTLKKRQQPLGPLRLRWTSPGKSFWLYPALRSPGDTAAALPAPRLRRGQLCIQRVKESRPGVPCLEDRLSSETERSTRPTALQERSWGNKERGF